MSNDSNEPGNDTAAAQAAFQVGDTVRFGIAQFTRSGEISEIADGKAYVVTMYTSEGAVGFHIPLDQLTLVSRPASSEMAWHIGDRVRFTLSDETYDGVVERLDPHDADSVTVSDTEDFWYILRRDQLTLVSRATSATPAPAATPPALDAHTLELPVRLPCGACAGRGGDWPGGVYTDCDICGGRGSINTTIRLSDEALHRLAGELVKRLPARTASQNVTRALESLDAYRAVYAEHMDRGVGLMFEAVRLAIYALAGK